jgi:gamma-glutamylcyclotransferase (GGCT)/AIG2-like uncharacterized protein YtfP
MGSTKQYLFVYGSFLREAASPAIRSLVKRLGFVANATVTGALYDVDGYPALTLDDSNQTPVYGEVVTVGSASAWLRLDTYEGVDRLRAQGSTFRRVRMVAKTEAGERVECWVYVYNRDLSAARRVECGCWRTHLLQQGDVTVVPC